MLHVSHIVNSVFSSRTYVLRCDECDGVWLVDCGDVEKLPSSTVVKGVMLTHAHFDHIYGLPKLLERFPYCKVVTNIEGFNTLADNRMNMSKYHETPVTVSPSSPVICNDSGDVELFDGVMAEVYETPGHHPSCLTFVIGSYIFTGDAYIPGTKVVTNLPGGNKEKAKHSVERVISLAEGRVICPGHEYPLMLNEKSTTIV